MTRHLAICATLAMTLNFMLLMTGIAEGQGLKKFTMASGDEVVICSGTNAAVTPNPPIYGELRSDNPREGEVRILYKAKDKSAGDENLTCTASDGKQTTQTTVTIEVNLKRSSTSGISEEAYPEAFKVLFLLFVLAIILESALAILFNWRPFIETFNARAVRPLVSLGFALTLVYMFALDLVTSLAKLIRPDVPALDDTGKILTGMVIAGGSAAVNNIMVGLGFRQARTPETVMPTPPVNKGWISVSIVRSDKIRGPVTVAIGVATGGQVPVVASLDKSTTPTYRYFFHDRGRFPGSGGYAVAKGDNVTVKVSALKADGSGILEKMWGPNIIADAAIIDLTFTMTE